MSTGIKKTMGKPTETSDQNKQQLSDSGQTAGELASSELVGPLNVNDSCVAREVCVGPLTEEPAFIPSV